MQVARKFRVDAEFDEPTALQISRRFMPPSANRTNCPIWRCPSLAEHAAVIRALGKRVVGDIIEIGRRLTDAKARCGHGNWLPWLDREFGWKDTTALRFMRCHEFAKSGKLADLALPFPASTCSPHPPPPTKPAKPSSSGLPFADLAEHRPDFGIDYRHVMRRRMR